MISLDKIVKNNIFKVPSNYFENLTLTIQQRVETQEEASFNLAKTNNFSTPKGYFDELSSKIFNRIEQIEQKNFDLENLARTNIFKTPNGYFENLDERINANVFIESLDKQVEFKVPDNYFQKLEVNLGIERFNKENVFNVPLHYFETLSENILSKIDSEKKGRVIHVNWLSNRVKWSAAASILLMFGLWFAVPQFTTDKTTLALEKVSNDDIKTYLETQDLSYLEYESVVENAKNTSKTIDSKVLDGLKINKQEIIEHLETQDLEEEI